MDVNALAALWMAARGPGFRKPVRRATLLLLMLPGLYVCAAAFWAGTRMGGGLAGLDATAAGTALWRLPLLLGAAGALWDGGCVVDPAPCRPHFVSLGTLVAAEGMLGLTTPVKRVLAVLGLAFSLGLGWGRPALLPMGLLFAGLALLWTACLERVIHVAMPAGLLRQRTFLATALGLGAASLGLALLAGRRPHLPFLPALERLWVLPGVHLVRFWQLRAPVDLLPVLGATAALLALTAACLRLELSRARRPGSALGGGRPWSFSRPWLGVARLQFGQIIASRSGQMRLLMLLLSVALAKEPELLTVGALRTPQVWAALAAGLTFGSVLVVPLCNLFGYDRGGVRTWWRAPIADRDLLLGKLLGCAGYALAAAPILLALTVQTQAWHLTRAERPGSLGLHVARSANPLEAGGILALALLLAALFLWWAGSGLSRSLRGAWPLTQDGHGVKLDFDEAKMARVGVLFAPLAWMVPLLGAGLALGWAAAAAAMAAALGLAALRLRRRLAAALGELEEGREALTASLCGSPG